MNRNFFTKSIKIIGIVLIMALSFQGCKVNIFDPLSPDGASLIDSAKSLTEKGDAFFAKGDLKSAETAYNAALKKDPNYGPALVGLAAVELQKSVSPDGTKTFTANVLPMIYKGLESLTATTTGSGTLAFEAFLANPAAKSIAEKKQVAQAAEKAFNTLIRLSNPDLTEMVNLSVLLGFNVIFKLAAILNSFENFQTILNQFETTGSGDNQFTLDYNTIYNVTPTNLGGPDVTALNAQLDNFRDIYQKLYYVYYLFSEESGDVIVKIDEIYSMLDRYFGVVSTSENEYILRIYDQAVTIKGRIENVYTEIQNAPAYTGRVEQAAGRIIEIEKQVQTLKNNDSSLYASVNADVSLCGITIEGVTGVVGESQLTIGSTEENLLPVISDDVTLPCTGANPRFEAAN